MLGEFGRYREKLAIELLKSVISQRLDIGTGFVITSKGKVSTQCDVIIYDKNNSPLIKNDNLQLFFPIECVVAIGEIKSDLNKSQLKEALLKLKKNKLLRNDIQPNNSYIFKDHHNETFNPKENIEDEIVTFLICNKFKFDYNNLVNEMDDLYDDDTYYLRHNMILSIENGILMYKGFPNEKQIAMYPEFNNKKIPNCLLQPHDSGKKIIENIDVKCNKYEHIVAFLDYMYMGTSMASILYPEMTNYLARTRLNKTTVENINKE